MSSEAESIVKYLFSDYVLFWPSHHQKTFIPFKCLKVAGNFIPWLPFSFLFFLNHRKDNFSCLMGHSVLKNWTVPFICIEE